jgi:hypothetical protein
VVYPGHPWFGSPSFDIKYDPGGGQEAAGRGGLQRHKKAQDQDRDLDFGLGPDAAAADERVRAGEPERGGFDASFEVMEWNALVTFSFQP